MRHARARSYFRPVDRGAPLLVPFAVLAALRDHARAAAPFEAGGNLHVVDGRAVAFEPVANLLAGELGVYKPATMPPDGAIHTHSHTAPRILLPSPEDIAFALWHGLEVSAIYSVPLDSLAVFRVAEDGTFTSAAVTVEK